MKYLNKHACMHEHGHAHIPSARGTFSHARRMRTHRMRIACEKAKLHVNYMRKFITCKLHAKKIAFTCERVISHVKLR